MKRAVDDSLSGTDFSSPVDNGKSKKLKLFHGTDSPELSKEVKYSKYGSKAKLVEEILLIRNGRLKVALKFESNSVSESSGTHSNFANNALATTPRVEEDEDVQLQTGDPTPVLEDLVDPSVASDVEIVDGILPLKGNAFPDYVPIKPRSRRRTKMSCEKTVHLIMKDANPQVLDDHMGIEESPNDAVTLEIINLGDDANEKGPEIAVECSSVSNKILDNLLSGKSPKHLVLDDSKGMEESPDYVGTLEIIDSGDDANEKGPEIAVECSSASNKILDESHLNLLSRKSPKPLVLDDSKGIEESPNKVGVFETIHLEDDDSEKGPEILEECSVTNKVSDKSQINILSGKSTYLDDNTASDGEEALETDRLDDMWMEFGMAIEISKGNAGFDNSLHDNTSNKPNEDCEHSLILRDDIGHVCRICGKVEMDIQKIFEFQYKTPRSSRTYKREPQFQGIKDPLEIPTFSIEMSGNEDVTNISAHPRHAKQMKPHQVEGFRFLARNLVSDRPSGCILAHAPGSGKTFMIISFIQSFMGKYPNARPLIILPKGILAVWKTEFLKWQIEDIPLYDLYSSKPDRSQQLEVLSKWVKERSILFMGYMQFSSIMSGVEKENNVLTASCQKILSGAPSLLILDEGHTPRNNETEIVNSISKVKTPRKVVLSGTLYQNHVREVFNILNLVFPKFLQSETSSVIVKRIMSRVAIGGKRINKWSNGSFHELVEQTLQSDDLNVKLHVIKDLREMTQEILHYYKGDFLDDLPGLEDYTVVLNQTAKQLAQTKKLKRIRSLFKRSSVGSAVYLHPDLKQLTDDNAQANNEKQTGFDDAKIDRLIQQVDINDGAKAKFFMNVLRLCKITGEKLLVFSQYLLPLKFLERLTMEMMNWSPGLEIFMITGDSSSEMREKSMNQFNNTPSAKVFFGSIKACGEGISLVGASRIIILDVHPNPSVTRQAVGRAFRPGQKNKVFVYRLIAAESMEEEDHKTYFRKELISKLWFEWNEHRSMKAFELKQINTDSCGDNILESPHILSDVKALYKR